MEHAPASLVPPATETSDSSPPPPEPRALPLPGETLGPYRLIFELASGGMATIYLAVADGRAGAHRLVAIKRLHPHLAGDVNYRQMFLDEAHIASQIRHPNVCTVFDYGEHHGTPYIVMEYLAGETLATIWQALRRDVSESELGRRAVLAGRIVADACEALHAAHELKTVDGELLNVVHRDVSPENVIVTYDGVVKLCDFGIAIAAQQEHRTETGMLKGKYAYIQPEALRGQRPDRRSDIFSLGIVLWELVTGERLFRRDSAVETLRAVSEALVPAPSAVIGAGSELDGVVMRALAPEPDERFPNAREFGKALNSALGSSGRQAGIGEVAEWMNELFPGGRANKERLVETIATHYEPLLAAADRGGDGSVSDDEEAATLAIATREIIPPSTRRPSVGSVRAPLSSANDRKWQRAFLAFAFGAVVGGILLSPSKSELSLASRAGAPPVARAASTVSKTELPVDAMSELFSGRLEARPPRGDEPVANASSSCERDIGVVGASFVGSGRSSFFVPDAADSSSDDSKRERRHSGTRSSPQRVGSIPARGPSLVAPVRSLELGPEFAAYERIRLLSPSLVVVPTRSSSDSFPRSAISIASAEPSRSIRVSSPRRALSAADGSELVVR